MSRTDCMSDQELLPITPAEISPGVSLGETLLALNNEHAQELSWIEPARLQHLVEQNFLWFRLRYPRFVYVDRIVVTAAARGRGHARRLYDELFRHALEAGHEHI